jgi:hypothetical protein
MKEKRKKPIRDFIKDAITKLRKQIQREKQSPHGEPKKNVSQ